MFPTYGQKENRTTNYCLLMLKLLYEENPKYLQQVVSTLVNEEISDHLGVKFLQQQKKDKGIIDGLIIQRPIAVYIETKNFDWFYTSQLLNHLSDLSKEPGHKVLMALSNFEHSDFAKFEEVKEECKKQSGEPITFVAASFEDFLLAIEGIDMSKNLRDMVEDFKDYLNQESLLPSWKDWLDVVNCAGYPEDLLEHQTYICPATGGAYNHNRCKFFGMYRNKKVEKIALIKAVVDIESEEKILVKWSNIEGDKDEIAEEALKKAIALMRADFPIRVFLLDQLHDTEFIKDTPGGMMGSKQYFNVRKLNVTTAQEVAEKLKDKKWSEF